MNGPLVPNEILTPDMGLAFALIAGLLFGFFLERAGFGSARKLTAIFYLQDFAVLKVMFTAVVVGAVGLLLLGGAELLDSDLLAIPPTYLWPQAVGGLLIGLGFVLGGY
ncbi:MAG: YeeE/YedE family protein [Deltaproteobacteria bacterium]|nr:YeeE/YedE family protein [Deltaproteobacteria bacterium]